jgi:hypothetical protein
MIRKLIATIYLLVVFTINYFYDLNNISLIVLFAIFLIFLWVEDIAKLKSRGK